MLIYPIFFSDLLNTRVSVTTGKTPFEIIFGQRPNKVDLLKNIANSSIMMEEDLEGILVNN